MSASEECKICNCRSIDRDDSHLSHHVEAAHVVRGRGGILASNHLAGGCRCHVESNVSVTVLRPGCFVHRIGFHNRIGVICTNPSISN